MKRAITTTLCALVVLTAWAQPTIPDPMPLVDTSGREVLNLLLIGTATYSMEAAGLTDALLLLSFDRTHQRAAIVSLPRDLYVYLPSFDMMAKLNQAYYFGERNLSDGITGIDALKAAVLYNLGVQVDYTARVNFTGFVRLIDALGGIDITVDCALQDWKLKTPDADIYAEESYELFTLERGYHHLDGHTALWYVRSRRTTSDFDRSRRQQDVLRALWRRIQARGLLNDLPALWQAWERSVQTDMPLEVALSLLPSVVKMTTADLDYYTFKLKQEVENGYTPDADRRFILIPNREAIARLMRDVVAPPTSRLEMQRPLVAVVNGTGVNGMARLAADRLELEGFRTVIVEEPVGSRRFNLVIDYTGLEKGNPIDRILSALATTPQGVRREPDPARQYDYKVLLGRNYPYYACTRPIDQPVLVTPTPPSSEATETPAP